ncbi:MAG: hypothetical protein Q8S11_14520 [Daejeonella sp.]|uniref:hypothetical protein n=1 Tax=Daejeonella sp. TaxID=2805397 RepID=UPI002732992A|nr:hypothetical protein [Daejeonella sp.]MDP3469552.1 hypothetical protein [Daejeonella sp.]
MKRLFFTIIAASLFAVSCNSGADQAEKARQDSLAEVAAADSMLNAAMEADSLIQDTITVDSIQ